MLTNPTSKDFDAGRAVFDAGRAVREKRTGKTRIVIGFPKLFATVKGGT